MSTSRVIVVFALVVASAAGISGCAAGTNQATSSSTRSTEPATPTRTAAPVEALDPLDGVEAGLPEGWQRVESPDGGLTLGVPASWHVGYETAAGVGTQSSRGWVPPESTEFAWKGTVGDTGSPGVSTTISITSDPAGTWDGSWEGTAEQSYRSEVPGAQFVGIAVNTNDGSEMQSGPYQEATISILADTGTQYTLTVLPPQGDDGTRIRQVVGSLEIH